MFLLLQESLQASYWNANKYERASSESIYIFVWKLWDSSKAFMRGFFIFLASKTTMKKARGYTGEWTEAIRKLYCYWYLCIVWILTMTQSFENDVIIFS